MPITLVGTMHYNPASATIAANAVVEAATAGNLDSVLVELCEARWNASRAREFYDPADMQAAESLKSWLRRDEFQAAFVAAENSGVEKFVLADQDIGETIRRVPELLMHTLQDLFSGPAGWRRIADDLLEASRQLLSGGAGSALLDPEVLVGVPLALLRGPVASPALGTLLISTLVITPPFFDAIAADTTVVSLPERIWEASLPGSNRCCCPHFPTCAAADGQRLNPVHRCSSYSPSPPHWHASAWLRSSLSATPCSQAISSGRPPALALKPTAPPSAARSGPLPMTRAVSRGECSRSLGWLTSTESCKSCRVGTAAAGSPF